MARTKFDITKKLQMNNCLYIKTDEPYTKQKLENMKEVQLYFVINVPFWGENLPAVSSMDT